MAAAHEGPGRPVTRFECINRNNTGAGYHHSKGDGQPRRKRCAYCKGTLYVLHGWWGLFTWTGTGQYYRTDALGLFRTERDAEHACTKPDEQCVRWVMADPSEVEQR